MGEKIILVGAFHEMVELCERCNKKIVGIIDNEKSGTYMDYKIIGTDSSASKLFEDYNGIPVIISPDNPQARNKLVKFYEAIGFNFTNLISPKANFSRSYILGRGVVIQDGVNVSSNVKIGNFARLNTNSNVMHDSIVGDFSTIAPNSVILGRVQVGQLCYVGANSTILPDLTVGDESTVGAGSVVTRSVESKRTVTGNPAKAKSS